MYNGKCNHCFQCVELSKLYDALNRLSASIKLALLIEEQFIQKYLSD